MKLIELLESKEEFIVQKQGPALVSAYQRNERSTKAIDPTELINQLIQADPSKQHLQWIVNQYIKGQFKLEDLSKIKQELSEFNRVRSKLKNKDLNSYGSLNDLYNALEPFQKKEVVSGKQQVKNETQQYFDSGEAELIYRDETTVIISPKTTKASCFFGIGTKWCTAGIKNNNFDQYNDDGPLYIISHNGKKYQFQFETTSFMNERDQEISKEEFDQFRTQIAGTKRLFAAYELSIVEEPKQAYEYARDVINGRWPKAEPYIVKSPRWAHRYAKDVIRGRWPEAEPYIMKDSLWAHWYALEIIEGRWPEAEPYIVQNPAGAVPYARDVMEGRWPEAEPYIMRDPKWACWYAKEVIGGRWPEAEPYIMKSPQWAYWYARDVIEGRWPEAEPYIMNDSQWKRPYEERING